MIGYVNGEKIYLNENMPVYHGKAGEDLNSLTTTQIRTYQAGSDKVANAPTPMGQWFSVQVLMQNAHNGTMMIIGNDAKLYLRSYQSDKWGEWREI